MIPDCFSIDRFLSAVDEGLRRIYVSPVASRVNPSTLLPRDTLYSVPLTAKKQAISGSLMRVNHVGEVCAQALYSAQAFASPNTKLKAFYNRSRIEEIDHLAWTRQRLNELGDRQSILNPLWYAGAFGLGLAASLMGEAASLGFVVETERQVEAHLRSHLDRLPIEDLASRAIVAQMAHDESGHGAEAAELGGTELPASVKFLMKTAAKAMTTIAHYI